jgi:hypothetical protein
MNKALKLLWSFLLAAVAGAGAASATEAFEGTGYDAGYDAASAIHSREQGQHARFRGMNQITGVWRLESRAVNGREMRTGGWMAGIGAKAAGLPSQIQIERERGRIQVASRDGTVLRSALARQMWSARGFTMHTTAPNGRAVREHYSVTDGGQRLIVTTTVEGARRNREITTVYQRA